MAEVAKGIIDIEINTGSAAAQLKALQQQINAFNIAINKNNSFQSKAAAQYTTELKDLINSSRFFTAETVKMRTAAGALDDTLRKGRATLGQYFSARLNKNSALFAETMALASDRARTMQTQFVATGSAARGMQDALAIKPLAAFNSQIAITSQRTQILSSMFRQGTTQLINFGKNVQWAGRQLMVGFTVPLSIFATTAGRTFIELEKQAVAFKKVYGDIFTTPAELNQNLSAVQGLSREFTKYGIAAKDTMSLAAQAAAAGRRNADLTDAVTQATRLATLGQMDQNSALETTIALQSAFRLSGQELSDTINFLNMVENQTVVSLQDLAAAIPRVAPVIKGLGGDVRDMSVFLAAMQEGGVSAEQGANALKSGLASLINPTKQAKEMLAGFNINIDAIISKNKGDLMGTVTTFAQALQTLDEFQRQQALEQVFGKFQYARLGALFENIVRDGSQASQVLQTMGYSTEDLAKTAEKELSVIEQSFGVQLTAAIEKLKLELAPIGEMFVKMAIPIVNFITKIAEGFNNLPDFSKKFIALATIITGLVIPAGTMFFGLLMNLTGQLAKIVQTAVMFGKGMVSKGGIVGGIQAVSQSMKYMSIGEIEASIAAKQLGSATNLTNQALKDQAIAAGMADAAVKNLANTYQFLINRMAEAASLNSAVLGVPGKAMKSAKPKKFARGGEVPGSGNSDTVPAMLMPGEFVVTKKATRSVGTDFLRKLNKGGVAGYNNGTQKQNQYQKTERTHIVPTMQTTVGRGGIRTNSGVIPEGLVIGSLANKVLDLGSKFNKDLRTSTFNANPTVSEALSEFNRGTKIFKTMDSQFADFMVEKQQKMSASGMTNDQINNKLRSLYRTYSREKRMVVSRYKRSLGIIQSVNPNARLNDTQFSQISSTAFRNFDRSLPEFNSKLMSYGTARMREVDYISSMQNLGLNYKKGMSIEKMQTEINNKLVSLGRGPVPASIGVSQRISKTTGLPKVKKSGAPKLTGGYSVRTSTDYNYNKYSGRNILSKTLRMFGAKKFAKGGQVPSLLTPGEFVIDKNVAAQNRPFLDALNAGKVNKFQFGTKGQSSTKEMAQAVAQMKAEDPTLTTSKARDLVIKNNRGSRVSAVTSRLGGAAGAAAIPALIAGQALSASSNQAAQKIGAVANALTPVLFGLQILSPAIKMLATRLPFLTNPVGLVIAGLTATAGILSYVVNKELNKIADAGAAMTRAMYGSSENIEAMAKSFGRTTTAQKLAEKRASRAGEGITAEAQQFATQYIQSDAGKKILADIQKVKDAGGDAALAVRNQVAKAVIAGAITPDEAEAIAKDIGLALNDQMLAINAVGQISKLFGPNGELLEGNILKIAAEISPKFDLSEIITLAQKQVEEGGFWSRFFGIEENQVRENVANNINEILKGANENIGASMDMLTEQYEDNKIGFTEYQEGIKEQTDLINKNTTIAINSFAQYLGKTDAELKNLYDRRKFGNLRTKESEAVVKFFDDQRKAAEGALVGVGQGFETNITDAIFNGIANGDVLKATEYFNRLFTGNIDQNLINQIVKALNDQGLKDAAIAFRNYITPKVTYSDSGGIFGGGASGDTTTEEIVPTGEKSAFEQLKETYDQTMKYASAVRSLGKETNKEAISLIGATSMAEMNNAERKKAISLIKEQIAVQKIINFLLLSQQDQEIELLDVQSKVKDVQIQSKEREISAIEELNQKDQDRIDTINRQNDLDQRQTEIRNRALDQLSKREDEINKVYQSRFEALDNVANINDRIRQQQEDTISLASALTSGDIAAAASAANTMAANDTAYQMDQTRLELEAQQQREIDALTVSVNGNMMTRAQIEAEIDTINERIYQRGLNIQALEDSMYNRNLNQVKPLQQEINALNKEREDINFRIDYLQAQIAQKEYEQMLNVRGTNKLLGEKRDTVKQIRDYYTEMVNLYRNSGVKPPSLFNMGGVVPGYMLGGMVNYKGSKEPAPGMMMGGKVKKYAVGNLVPGKGNVDRVPALLTPGEFVVRKSVAQQNLPLLKALNSDIFPSISDKDFGTSGTFAANMTNSVTNMPVYNNYSISVNVPNTNANPEDIANTVMSRIRRYSAGEIRGTRR